MLQAEVLSQILLMQTLMTSLPDEQSILNFVGRGLEDIPGVSSAGCAEEGAGGNDGRHLAFPVVVDGETITWLAFVLEDPARFAEYRPFVGNFCVMVGLVISQRRHHLAMDALNRELTKALELQERLQGELIIKEKVASLSPMSKVLAHELNTPIGGIRLVCTKLADSCRAIAEKLPGRLTRQELESFLADTLEASALIGKSAGIAVDLVNRFRQAVSQRADNHKGTVLLRELALETVQLVRKSYPAGTVRIHVTMAEDLRVESYPGAIAQVLEHLVANAIVHGFPEGAPGLVEIAASLDPDRGECHLVVADDGAGIPPENLGRVFEPFFTTRFGEGGNGLGLSIVYHVVTDILNGRIDLRSRPGGGAEFRVVFPV